MSLLNPEQYDPLIFKKALSTVLKRKGYHQAPPSKKQEMVLKEYTKILNKEKKKKK